MKGQQRERMIKEGRQTSDREEERKQRRERERERDRTNKKVRVGDSSTELKEY